MLSLVDGDSGWIACTLDPSREADPFPFHTSLNAGGCRSNTSLVGLCAARTSRPTDARNNYNTAASGRTRLWC